MSREVWNNIKSSKRFYISAYRWSSSILLVSIAVSLCLGSWIFYVYVNEPEHDFYATDGVTAPIGLMPLDAPNKTSVPLLGNDLEDSQENKVIP